MREISKYTLVSGMLVLSLFMTSCPAHAHGDHKDQPAESEPAVSPDTNENIYAAESVPAASPDLPLSGMDIAPDEHQGHKDMGKPHDEHAGHKMPQVKISSHEWVSTSQKGYGVAAGVTVLAGLFFCALSFIRPNE